MTDIARAAGVAVGTLYNYFPSKEEIFQEIFAARSQELHAQLAVALPSAPVDQLRYLVEQALAQVERHGAFFATFTERGGITEIDIARLGGEVPEREYERFLRTLEDSVRAGVKAGTLRGDISPRTLVAALSGAMNGVTYLWLKQKRRSSLAAYAPEVIDIFLAGARAAS
jgi:AcrR family transcriptional regulator